MSLFAMKSTLIVEANIYGKNEEDKIANEIIQIQDDLTSRTIQTEYCSYI